MGSVFREYDPETLRRLQKTELEILIAIDKVCKEHDITYFLDSGTALGAVRHGGFIPWDDDADIGMLRPDYDRFMEIAQEALGNRFVVSNPRINDKQAGLFGKVWIDGTLFETKETLDAGFNPGIYIDVFPYDVLNKDPKISKRQISIGSRWQKISYLYHSASISFSFKGLKQHLFKALCLFAHCFFKICVNQSMILKHLDKAIELGQENSSDDYVGLSYPLEKPFPISMLLPTRTICFEGHEFSVPGKTEDFLENIYGCDWTKLPPMDQRRNHAPMILRFNESDE